MTKSLRMTIETQTEENDVISMCYLNESMLALDVSPIAREMIRRNRALFDKINSSTKIVGGAVYRQEIVKEKPHLNRLMVLVEDSYEFREREIAALTFENNRLLTQERAITKSGKKFDFDRKNLKENFGAKQMFDPNNPTVDGLRDASLVSAVREVPTFQRLGVKTFIITDRLKDQDSLLEVGYRMNLKIDTFFKDYVIDLVALLNKSSNFISSYYSDVLQNYDYEKLLFKESFFSSIMDQLVEPGETMIRINSRKPKQSEFGRAAVAFYNAAQLMSNNVDKSIYKQIFDILLPTRKTNPESILNLSKRFANLYESIVKAYDLKSEKLFLSGNKSKISNSKNEVLTIETTTDEKHRIEKEALGYNVFSETKKGFGFYTVSDYSSRVNNEQTKFYPSLSLQGGSFLNNPERSDFVNPQSHPSFLTPSNLVLGNKTITTSRGVINMSPDDVREFRMAKSVRAKEMEASVFPVLVGSTGLSNKSLTSFNLTIAPPTKTILVRATEETVDPLVDAGLYLGDDSYFVTDNPRQFLKFSKTKKAKEFKEITRVVADIIPKRLLTSPQILTTSAEIQFANPQSRIRRLVNEKKIDLKMIPPQVKFMMTSNFSSPEPKMVEGVPVKIDPLQNADTSPIIQETQMNLFMIKGVVGFEKNEMGFLDVYRPIMREMNSEALNSGVPMIAKAYHYEVPTLGIVKDKFMPTIYNNLMFLRGR